MSEKPRCDICLNRVDNCICEREHKIVMVYVGACSDSMWELGVKLGMDEDTLHYFHNALSEVKVTIRVYLNTGKYEILKFEE